MAATCAHQFTASAAQCGHDRGDTEPSQVSCSRRIARGRFRRGDKKLKLKRALLHAAQTTRDPRHRTGRCTLRRRPVGTARQAPYEPTRHPPPCAARAAPRPKGGAGSASAVVEGLGAQARLASVGWPCRAPAHRQGQCSVRPCAEGGGSEQDERSVLRWRWEARHADRGAVALRGAQAGDGASRTANAIGPLTRHRHGVTAALSIRAVRRRPPLPCFRPM